METERKNANGLDDKQIQAVVESWAEVEKLGLQRVGVVLFKNKMNKYTNHLYVWIIAVLESPC